MAPSLGGRGGEEAAAAAPETAAPPPAKLANAQTQMLGPDPRTQALVEAVRRLRRHVTATADYVGDRFAEEARRIHYEEAERRSIYGEASAEDARALADEGIEVQPLPRLPDERN